MNSWIFSIACNYGSPGYISNTAESILRTSVINFSIVKNDEIIDTSLHMYAVVFIYIAIQSELTFSSLRS